MHIYTVDATFFILNKYCNLVKIQMPCLKTKSHTALSHLSNLLNAVSL